MPSKSDIKFVVENDSFLRLIQVVLDPTAPKERFEAFAHFCKHDTPDFQGWCDKIRAQARNIYPANVRLVDDQAELVANVSGASVIVVEELTAPDCGSNGQLLDLFVLRNRHIDMILVVPASGFGCWTARIVHGWVECRAGKLGLRHAFDAPNQHGADLQGDRQPSSGPAAPRA